MQGSEGLQIYQIEQASLVYRWSFLRMLPALPGPGSVPFGTLCKELHPYGLLPSEIFIDASSSRLSEVSLGMNLLNGRLAIRITFAWVEFVIPNLLDEDESALLKVAEIVTSALSEIDVDAPNGNVQVNYRAHLSMVELQPESFLDSYLRSDTDKPQLIPDGLAYKINRNGNVVDGEDIRLVFTRSLTFPDGIYIDLSIVRQTEGDPLGVGRRLAADIETYLNLFDLRPDPNPR